MSVSLTPEEKKNLDVLKNRAWKTLTLEKKIIFLKNSFTKHIEEFNELKKNLNEEMILLMEQATENRKRITTLSNIKLDEYLEMPPLERALALAPDRARALALAPEAEAKAEAEAEAEPESLDGGDRKRRRKRKTKKKSRKSRRKSRKSRRKSRKSRRKSKKR